MNLGLEPKSHFLGEANAYISLTSLLLLTSVFDGKNDNYRELVWLDVLAALIKETPKLKYQVKLKEFRASVVATLVTSYRHFLELDLNVSLKEDNNANDDADQPEVIDIADEPSIKTEWVDVKMEDLDDDGSDSDVMVVDHEHAGSTQIDGEGLDTLLISDEEFGRMRNEMIGILGREGGRRSIGDWEVAVLDEQEVRLVVDPAGDKAGGPATSLRKISYLQPDVCAMLKYELTLRRNGFAQLLIGEKPVPASHFAPVFRKSCGAYNLLFNLSQLRPCFGNYSQELVETVEQNATR